MFRNREYRAVLIALVWIITVVCVQGAFAQGNTLPQPAVNTVGSNRAGPVSLLSNYEFWLTISVMVFGSFSMGASLYATHRGVSAPDQIIRVISVNLIVVGTLVTITAGLSDKQIAPAFGLFGTIAGYLLGRSERSSQASTETSNSGTNPGDKT